MVITLVRHLMILLCGYAMINWLSIERPFYFTDFILQVILHPLEFFASTLALCIGVIMSGGQVKEIIQRHWRKYSVLNLIGIFIVYSNLIHLSWIHSIILFSLSLIYGIISVKR
ncbi:hypothetical protein [Neobacillus sp. Marseille-QA0830]